MIDFFRYFRAWQLQRLPPRPSHCFWRVRVALFRANACTSSAANAQLAVGDGHDLFFVLFVIIVV